MVDINIYDKDLKDMTLGEAYRMLLLKTEQVDHSSHVKKELSRKMIKLVRIEIMISILTVMTTIMNIMTKSLIS